MILRRAVCLVILAVAPLGADEVQLSDGARLTGRVLELGSDGQLRLESELAEKPLRLRADRVIRVDFGGATRSAGEHDARVTLVNGDTVPCNLRSIDDGELQVATSYAGEFGIPRHSVRTVQLGIRPARVVYQGPENLGGWKVGENWQFEDGALVSHGTGTISRDIEGLPESFALSFRLGWATRPNFQVYFCSDSPEVASGGDHDRYFMTFNNTGIELKRQSSGRARYQSLATVPRTPDMFPDRQVHFEIRLDRRQRMLLLYVDGELEGRYPDPFSRAPVGTLVVLKSNSSGAEGHRVTEFTVREWDAAGERHKSEDRGDPDLDALIDNEGDRYRGQLIGSRGAADELMLLFKSQHYPDPLEIPANRVSTLFFRDADGEREADDKLPLTLSLAERGQLGAADCVFSGEQVKLTHPLLGPLKIDRSAVRMLNRRDMSPDEDPEPEPESAE